MPAWCVFENVRGILSLESGVVFDSLLSELEAIGYETQTFIIPACAVDAPHRRDRVWIVGYAGSKPTRGNNRRKSPRTRVDLEKRILDKKRRDKSEHQPNSSSEDVANPNRNGTQRDKPKDGQGCGIKQGCENVADPTNAGAKGVCGRENKAAENVADTQGNTIRPGLCEGGTGEIRGRRSGDGGEPGNVADPRHPSGTPRWAKLRGSNTQGRKGQTVRTKGQGCNFRGARWLPEPDVGRVAHGVPNRVDRLKCLGNAVVPQIVEIIGRAIMKIEYGINSIERSP